MKYTFTLKKLVPVYQTLVVEAYSEDDAFDMVQPVDTEWNTDPTLVLDWEIDAFECIDEEEEEETN